MTRPTAQAYIPQLDSLRAIAVALVIISHWLPASQLLNRFTPNGVLGVTLFFVLSGYLISGILLKNKEQLGNGLTLKNAFSIFYVRRSLRIFPVYYLFLLLLMLIYPAAVKPSIYWHIFYLSNFYFWHINAFAAQLSHLWSLAVEEQFYLLWPAIILLVKRSYLPAIFFGCMAGAMIFRGLMYAPPNSLGRLLMPGSLDSFGIGALLAYGQFYRTNWYLKLLDLRKMFLAATTIMMGAVHVLMHFYQNDFLVLVFYYFFISVFFFALLLVVSVNHGRDAATRLILQNRVLIYLGKVSYGLYLFHLVIPSFNTLLLPAALSQVRLPVIMLLRCAILVTVVSASWYFFEKPFLVLKNRFSSRFTTATHPTAT